MLSPVGHSHLVAEVEAAAHVDYRRTEGALDLVAWVLPVVLGNRWVVRMVPLVGMDRVARRHTEAAELLHTSDLDHMEPQKQ